MTPRRRTRFNQIVLGHLKNARVQMLVGLLCIAGTTLAALLAPWPLKLVFDHVLLEKPWPDALAWLPAQLPGGQTGLLAALALTLVGIAFITGGFAYYQQFITSRLGYQVVHTLRGELFAHLQRLSLSFHSRARTGELMSKITSDTNTLRDVFAEYILLAATHVLTVAGMFAVLLAIEWRLGLIVLASFPVLFALLFFILRRVKSSARRQRSNEGRLASRVGEVLGAVSLVQAFGRERYERERFDAESAESMRESIRTARMEAAATRMVELVTALGTALVAVFGGLAVVRGRMSPGDLLVFLAYVTAMYKPVKNMARLSAKMSKALVSADRINDILEIEPEVADAPDAISAHGLVGEITFENVSFGYEPEKPILRNVCFTIPAGRRVALVGGSGAGKSTIANLIVRLHDPDEGRVLLDGLDLKRFQRESLRREIGIVLQHSLLFGATVRENIAYGKPEASEAEIVAAAREAHAHDFIANLPDGYDEVLGQGGGTLSGGQRQRLCLARALIKRPSLLIMDEPTSAVDAESESQIRDAVRRLQAGRTTLVIAHQLYSVEDADWVLVLKDGRVVEQGTPAELARHGAHYRELFQLAVAQAA